MLVEPDMTHAVAAVMELERFVDAGHNYAENNALGGSRGGGGYSRTRSTQVKRVNVARSWLTSRDVLTTSRVVSRKSASTILDALLIVDAPYAAFHVSALIVYL